MSRYTDDATAMDRIAQRRQQWARELPDLDTVGMAILGRARWISLKCRPAIEGVFERHGLDTGEFDVLSTLLRAGAPYSLRPTELFRSLMVSSGGLTPRLAKLEKRGLISRERSGTDSRSLLVTLTEQGRALTERALREDMAVEAAILAVLSDGELASLAALLSKLVRSLDVEEDVISGS